jgi:hypothetical protein
MPTLLLLLHNIVSRSEAATTDNRLLFLAKLLMRLTKIGDLPHNDLSWCPSLRNKGPFLLQVAWEIHHNTSTSYLPLRDRPAGD